MGLFSDFKIRGGVLTKYTGRGGDVVIPERVTAIGEEAFFGCTALSSVKIPAGVSAIGDKAFFGCTALSSVEIPEGVSAIGAEAFAGCTALEKVVFPTSLTAIGARAFYECKSLAVAVLPATSLGEGAFSGCAALGRVDFLRPMTAIPPRAFADCTLLLTITIPAGVTEIGEEAFSGCSALRTLALPEGLERIGKNAFLSCGKLSSVHISDLAAYCGICAENLYASPLCNGTGALVLSDLPLTALAIPEGVTAIGSYIFAGWRSLASVTFPQSVTAVGEGAFFGCGALSTLHLPASVTEVGSRAFCLCTSLLSVLLERGLTEIADHVFDGCKKLTSLTLPEGLTEIAEYAFDGCTKLTSLTLPEGLVKIGALAFRKNTSLTTLIIPESVKTLSYHSFEGCEALKTVVLPKHLLGQKEMAFGPDIKDKKIFQETLFKVNNGRLLSYYGEGGEVTVPDGVKEIGDEVFTDDCGIHTLHLPASLSSVAIGAFRALTSLRSVTAPAWLSLFGVTLFGERAEELLPPCEIGATYRMKGSVLVDYCGAGGDIVIPAGVTAIGDGAFCDRADITDMILPDTVTRIGRDAFRGCKRLSGIVIPATVTEVGDGAFAGCKLLEEVLMPAALRSRAAAILGGTAAAVSYMATTPIVTEGDCILGVNTDAGEPQMLCDDGRLTVKEPLPPPTVLTIPEGIRKIADGAFRDCTTLTVVTVPATVREIGEAVFAGCTALTSVKLPDEITAIGAWAFSGCSALLSVALPHGLERIGWGAFSGCASLREITVPEGVTEIGDGAFFGCLKLRGVTLPESLPREDCPRILDEAVIGSAKLTLAADRALDFRLDGDGVAVEYLGRGGRVILPRTARGVGARLFADRRDITSVRLPEGVTAIGEEAFFRCSLKCLDIRAAEVTVGEDAFLGCREMTELLAPRALRRRLLAELDPEVAARLADPAEDTAEGDGFVTEGTALVGYRGDAAELALPEGITVLCCGALDGKAVNILHLPASLREVEEGALSYLSSLDEITVAEGNAHFKAEGGALLSADGEILYRVRAHYHGTLSVTARRIADGAAYGLAEFTDLSLAASVREIGDFAFGGCEMLERIEIAPDHGGLSVGEGAFDGCPRLSRISCPASLAATLRAACPTATVTVV